MTNNQLPITNDKPTARGIGYWSLVIGNSLFIFVLAAGFAFAQDEMPPEPGEGEQPEEPKGSLQPRPAEDAATAAWINTLAGTRARSLSVQEGAILRHMLTPEGDRFYYYREASRAEGKEGAPDFVTYALYTVGPEKAEAKIAETGVDALPPLFLADGRIVFASRRYDRNDDGVVDELDEAALIVANRDGGNTRQVATLAAGEMPVAGWREDRELLVATPGDDDVSGWIVSLNLVTGKRERVVQAFNVSMVLQDSKLLLERMQAPEPPRGRPNYRRAMPDDDKDVEAPKPTLLDYVHYTVFDPKDGSVSPLYRPSRKSALLARGEGSYFGVQEREPANENNVRYPANMQRGSKGGREIQIVDDAEHRDTRAPSSRFDYEVLAWINGRGLLLVERGNLRSRLMLMDRALKFHQVAEFPLEARGFTASRDGLTVGWVEVEDTDKNGHLQPWKDNARPHFLKIE
jgi:hypothetical protein